MKTSSFNHWLFLGAFAIPGLQAGDPASANPQAVADLLKNPAELFQKLDTDGNGILSREEFLKVAASSSQEAAVILKVPTATSTPNGEFQTTPNPAQPVQAPTVAPTSLAPAPGANASKLKP